ncbi:MAG: hypothetical protein D4R98_04450 [Comamonadaceae bacterium]|nr:MAG: hypothetical protein D4R98_04450 [Comamonadaceae bacterium]
MQVLVANFAAVHREPGHEDWEYYETNLYGAENVCAWAESVGCKHLFYQQHFTLWVISDIER